MKLPHLLIVLGFTFLGFYSCEKDDDGPGPQNKVIDVGSYALLPSSIDRIPYVGKSGVIFEDSLGNRMTMQISELPIADVVGAYWKFNVFEEGDTIRYNFHYESKSWLLRNDSLDFTLKVSAEALPDIADPESQRIGDYVKVGIPIFQEWESFLFRALVDQRSSLSSQGYVDTFPEYEIFNRQFTDVLKNHFVLSSQYVLFNFKEGIIVYQDNNRKRWRFEAWQ